MIEWSRSLKDFLFAAGRTSRNLTLSCLCLPHPQDRRFAYETKRDTTRIADQIAPQEAKPKEEAADTALSERVNPRRVVELADFNTKGQEAGKERGPVQSLRRSQPSDQEVDQKCPKDIATVRANEARKDQAWRA